MDWPLASSSNQLKKPMRKSYSQRSNFRPNRESSLGAHSNVSGLLAYAECQGDFFALGQVRIPRLIRYVFVYGKLNIVQRLDQGRISDVDASTTPYFGIDVT